MTEQRTGKAPERFVFIMVKPSHYDDDGYVIQWMRSAIPSNTLAALNGLAEDARHRRILGDGVEIELVAYDETNTRVRPDRLIKQIRAAGGRGMVAFVGVQSNQFPRALDLARPLRAAGIQVGIGGFHVSGCLSMLPELTAELKEAQALGISLFAGEAEAGRLDAVLRDAHQNRLKPLYNFMDDLPGLENEVTPILPATRVKRTAGSHSSFDAGRGCPFQCSFCTIINVQGRKSRYRSAADIQKIVLENYTQGIDRFFITDDNFARNKDWESVFDALIELREERGMDIRFIIQVDTLCHKTPRFIEKAGRAGVNRVFIGLENINPASLAAAQKGQNKITEYRAMLQAWKSVGALTYAGYILGFPGDTKESIQRDIRIIQKELPLDLLEFFYLTPLPGSQDHQTLWNKGVPIDPDLNRYDLNHCVAPHDTMSREEWDEAYKAAWDTYYTPEHIGTVMRRAAATGLNSGNVGFLMVWFYGCITIEGIHPLEGGYLRRKYRRDRRSGLPLENPLVFYPRYAWETAAKHLKYAKLGFRVWKERKAIKGQGKEAARAYSDLSLEPVGDNAEAGLELYQSDAARAAMAHEAKVAALKKQGQQAAVHAAE